MLTVLAASGHLAYNALCFVSFTLPLAGLHLLWGPKRIFYFGPNTLSAAL